MKPMKIYLARDYATNWCFFVSASSEEDAILLTRMMVTDKRGALDYTFSLKEYPAAVAIMPLYFDVPASEHQ